jgi:hypothetical protein
MEISRPVRFVSSSFSQGTKFSVDMDTIPRVGDHVVISARGDRLNGDYKVTQVVHGIDGSDYDGPVVELEKAKVSLP